MSSSALVSVVVPCHNEEGNIAQLHQELVQALQDEFEFELLFIDDGSTDDTVAAVQELIATDKRVKLIELSRNFGHQAALKAGLDHATGNCVISMDADLQHPPSVMMELLQKWQEGFEVVYTQRLPDKELSFLKRKTSYFFYRLAQKLSSVPLHKGTADFRLLDRKVVDVLCELEERYLFYRGLVSWVGFRQTAVEYKAADRFAGKTNYTYRKMLSLALSGITSFSIRPLQLSIVLGFIIATLAGIYGMYVIYAFAFTDQALPGWTSTTASVLFIGGIQLILLGILGEYVGKGFMEGKRRPPYVIRKKEL